MKIMRVSNVEEAVALATQLQQAGTYNWFRGQVREWAPSSSLERRLREHPDDRANLNAGLNRFLAWIEGQPALRYLADPLNEHALFAVLQHYGFPTAYVDFTTDTGVAGFFASDCKTSPEIPGDSVIYCLDTADLASLYDMVSETSGDSKWRAEPVTVDVSNLWRLQAQRGHFLFVNHPWHAVYDMDRIVFPWSGMPAFPSKEHVYPLHKSGLEQLLDQYFFKERMFEANEVLQKMKRDAQGKEKPMRFIRVHSPAKYKTASFSAPLQALPNWRSKVLAEWHSTPAEHFDTTVGRRIPIPLRIGEFAPEAAQQVLQAISNAMRWQPMLRREAVEWSFTGLPHTVDEGLLMTAVRDAWNGMRNLPYTNDDIASAFTALVILFGQPGCRSIYGGEMHRAFVTWVPDAMEVEMANEDGSYSRAYCSDASLVAAIDPTWKMALNEDEGGSSAIEALRQTHDPRLMFDFGQLARVFARQVIPSQLAMLRPFVIFNPASLTAFGLP